MKRRLNGIKEKEIKRLTLIDGNNHGMKKVHVLTPGYWSANSQSFLNPLLINRRLLRHSGIDLAFFSSISDSIVECDYLLIDSKFFKPYWAGRSKEALEIIERLSQEITTVLWFHTGDSAGALGNYAKSILPFVKAFFKSQVYADKTLYQTPLYGNRLYTDFYHRHIGINDETVPELDSILDSEELSKIQVSWNIGFARCFNFYGEYIASLYNRFPSTLLLSISPMFHEVSKRRTRDTYTRMGLNFPRETVGYQRAQLALLMGKQPRVSRAQYYKEMKQSKVVVSPFGWGEINNRDFEAFIYGCLLLKPSMDHLETYPNFFIERETYISYKWDLSDMKDVIEDAVHHYKQYREIAHTAQQRYVDIVFSRTGRENFVRYFFSLLK